MKLQLHLLTVNIFETSGRKITDIFLRDEIFIQPLFSAPVNWIKHSLTGYTSVSGKQDLLTSLISFHKALNIKQFNAIYPRKLDNAYDGFFNDDLKSFSTKEIAGIFLLMLKLLNIHRLFCIIDASVGAFIAREMTANSSPRGAKFIAVASYYKTSHYQFLKIYPKHVITPSYGKF
ncbi:MAG: hypothetical protein Q4F57_08370 [Weeksellaceae bacterium]|nr:hypothetical protein [Weeksellaceae bacterium]